MVGIVLNKASAQREYGYYGGYQPFVMPAETAPGMRASYAEFLE